MTATHARVVSVGDSRNATRMARALWAACDEVAPDLDGETRARLAEALIRCNETEGLRLTGQRFTVGELMAMEFTTDDELRWLTKLVDEGHCSPICLFAMEEGSCQCRCQGVHHGAARPAVP